MGGREEKSVRFLKGVGPRGQILLNRLKIYSLEDLWHYFPLRYQDRRQIRRIKDLKRGEWAFVRGRVMVRNIRRKKFFSYFPRVNAFEIILGDDSGKIKCVWFNQLYLANHIKVGDELFIYGKVTEYKGALQFNSPEYEKAEFKKPSPFNFGRIVGVYRLTEGLTQKRMRKIIFESLYHSSFPVEETLPFYIREEEGFPNKLQSLRGIHFPSTFEEANKARQRFIFEELFFSQIMVYLRKAKRVLQKGIKFNYDSQCIERIRSNLDFSLTPSQEEAIKEIIEDMQKPFPMHRLLQGDVGSGKTAVAIFAIGLCAVNNFQACLMVPTEVLAHQHYETLSKVFKGFNFRIEFLLSGITRKKREEIIRRLEEGKIDIVVGTHALLEEAVKFKRLGLVVIDEQHKFGVAQRALLPKKGINPDCLVMSATPIPRSLALSLYGDLDLSVIKGLPQGRKQPKTIVVEEDERDRVYRFVKDKLREGRQAYIIYPVIEGSQEEVQSLKENISFLKKEFAGFPIEIFHGRQKREEKLRIIKGFNDNRIKILVATTVVEVGIDIENATVMAVENPERFGLAQLHQLRGRIRRSIYEPYFILIKRKGLNETVSKRLAIIEKIDDGFKLAEEDLKLRGPGDFFGHLQWGFPQLKIANPLKDIEILNQTRRLAYQVVKKDPHLEKPYHKSIRKYLKFWFKK